MKHKKKENPHFVEENVYDLCASVQRTIVDILIEKLLNAAKDYGIKDIAIAGGVSANSLLRKELKNQESKGYKTYIPHFQYCVDNAGMIAMAAYYQYLAKDFAALDFEPKARWHIGME
ncbi:MAG: hypothetical protein LRY27_02360 [Chitinophagales bacterium]|nr:hypothetical protein [Chitinophagales bacterium]